ncbi:UPF0711 protein C18orf21 homolog isoform X2 [Clinocottus analis]|uniref:UPF0711 protein C18orf21 homolog isoform X2 n=1 Tax=Clinocottus analis TaxID=304258 RepID=UPI0035BF8A07
MKTIFEGKSVSFLLDASLLYKDTCPELSRFFLQWPVKAKAPAKQKSSRLLQSTSACSYCYQWLQPDNHRVRLRPKRRPSARVQSVLRRKARGKRLSLVQRNLLQRFQKSCSVLLVALGSVFAASESSDRREPLKSPSGDQTSAPTKSSSRDGHLPHLQQNIQTQRCEQGVHGYPRHTRECWQTQDPTVDPQSQHDHP